MKTPTKLVLHVSIFFLILFTAFGAFQNIVTKIHEEEGDKSLGPFQLAISYSVFLICNIFVAKFSQKYSQKWLMAIPSLGYMFHYILGFFLSNSSTPIKYLITALGATANGIGASFLWTNVGTYIHKVCHIYDVSEEKGYYFGLFSVIYTASTILGALIVLFGLQLFSYKYYFLLISSIAGLSFLYAVFFIKDLRKLTQHQNIRSEEIDQEAELISTKQQFFKTLGYYIIMAPVIGSILIDGINIGVSSSTMLHLLPNKSEEQNKLNIGLCLVLFGVGGTIGGFIGGKACDRKPVKQIITLSLILYVFLCASSAIIFNYLNVQMAIGCCFLWGFDQYFLEAALMVACSRIYNGVPESFAIVKQFHSLSFVVYELVSIPTGNSLRVDYIMAGIVLFVFPALYGVTKLPYEKIFTKANQQSNSIYKRQQSLLQSEQNS